MKACPRIRLVTRSYSGGAVLDFDAMVTGRDERIGVLATERTDDGIAVSSVWVDPGFQRCGIGTTLYTAAAQWACSEGHRLRSDDVRSADSQGFWEKQERKGRAVCLERVEENRSGRPASYTGVMVNRGGCVRYQLKSCPITDLSGRKRQRPRRAR